MKKYVLFSIMILSIYMTVVVLISCEEPSSGSSGSSSGGNTAPDGYVQPETKAQLLTLISEQVGKDSRANLNSIDTSKISDMSSLFVKYPTFNGNISKWNVSNVVNMSSMFEGVTSFNGDISDWKVSKVTDMSSMFKQATAFNGNVSQWDVSAVVNMSSTFQGAVLFNADISKWDMSSVAKMDSMFEGARTFNQDTKLWNVAPLVSTSSKNVFKDSGVSKEPRWLTLEVALKPKEMLFAVVGQALDFSISRYPVTATGTFALTPVNTGDKLPAGMVFDRATGTITASAGAISAASKDAPIEFTVTFTGTGAFEKAENSNVTGTLSVLVQNVPTTKEELVAILKQIVDTDGNGSIDKATVSLNDIDVSGITDMSGLFHDEVLSKFTGDISGWDVSNVVNMNSMFRSSQFNGDISDWDVGKVVDMRKMFYEAQFTQDVEDWAEHIEGRKVDTTEAFSNGKGGLIFSEEKLPTWAYIFELRLNGSKIDTVTVVQGERVKILLDTQLPSSVTGEYAIHPDIAMDTGGIKFDKATGTISGIPTKQVSKKSYTIMFIGNGQYQGKSKALVLRVAVKENQGKYTHYPTSRAQLITAIKEKMDIDGDRVLDDIKADLNTIFTSNITDMRGVFYESSLRSFNGDISKWDVSNVMRMDEMFRKSSFTGDISGWDVSKVVNMNSMFEGSKFNGDISGWDVSKVADMGAMFKDNTVFNGNIASWKVGNVNNMHSLFYNAQSFNQDIRSWDVSNVVDMERMLYKAIAFDKDISGWAVDRVTDMQHMFQGANSFNQDLEAWKEHIGSRTVDTTDIFRNAANNGNIVSSEKLPSWVYALQYSYNAKAVTEVVVEKDSSSVVFRMARVPKEATGGYTIEPNTLRLDTGLTLDAATGDISGVPTKALSKKEYTITFTGTNAYSGKRASTSLSISINDLSGKKYIPQSKIELIENIKTEIGLNGNTADLNGIYTGYITNMSGIFYHNVLRDFNGDISGWDVSAVVNMDSMFEGSKFTGEHGDISGWNVSNVINMNDMFKKSLYNGNISGWDVSNVEHMSGMFQEAMYNKDITKWDVRNVVDMEAMFYKNTVFNQGIVGWNVRKVGNMKLMFSETGAFNQDISDWSVDSVVNVEKMFQGAKRFNQDLESWAEHVQGRTINKKDIFNTGAGDGGEVIPVGKIPTWLYTFSVVLDGKESNVLNVFQGKDIRITIEKKYPTKATGTYSISPNIQTDIGLTLNKDTGTITGNPNKAVSMQEYTVTFTGTREYAGKVFTLPLKITVVEGTYQYFPKSKAALITAIKEVMDTDENGKPDDNGANLNVIYTGNITDMSYVFNDSALRSFTGDISGWNVSNVVNMRDMFKESRFTGDISRWDVSNVRYMQGMFYKSQFTGDISGWDVSDVEQMHWMFRESQFNGDISNWKVSKVTNMSNMFRGAKKFNQDLDGWAEHVQGRTINKKDIFKNKAGDGFIASLSDENIASWIYTLTQTYEGTALNAFPLLTGRQVNIVLTKNPSAATGSYDLQPNTLRVDTGLHFNKNTGEIYGTPTRALASKSYTVKFTGGGAYSGKDVQKVFTIKVEVNNGVNGYKYFPTNKSALITAIKAVMNADDDGDGNANGNTANLNRIYTRHITDMSKVFKAAALRNFNGDISKWDVSNVKNMADMFNGSTFNGDISGWDVRSTTNIAGMFALSTFNGDISGWDVRNVTKMGWMFYKAKAFNKDISDWAVDKVTDMQKMFYGAIAFDQDVEAWKDHMGGRSVNISDMFKNASGNGLIASLSSEHIPSWLYTFTQTYEGAGLNTFPLLTGRQVSVVLTKYPSSATGSYELQPDTLQVDTGLRFNKNTGEIHGTPTKALVSKSYTVKFIGNGAYNGKNAQKVFTIQVEEKSGIYEYKYFPKSKAALITAIKAVMNADDDGDGNANGNTANLNVIYTGNISDMSGVFNTVALRNFNGDISKWNVSNVTNMNSMFESNTAFNGDITGWSVDSVTTMQRMFRGATSFDKDLEAWAEHIGDRAVNVSDIFTNASDTGYIFSDKTKIPSWAYEVSQSYKGTVSSSFIVFTGQDIRVSLTNTGVSNFDATGAYSIEPSTFTADTGLRFSASDGQISGAPTKAVSGKYTIVFTGNNAYAGKKAEQSFTITIHKVNGTYTYYPLTKSELQEAMKTLISAYGNDVDLNVIYTGHITNMSRLFFRSGVSPSFNGNMSQWDVSNVTNMAFMFANAHFNGDISNWNVSKVGNMEYMFSGSRFNGDISLWDVGNVRNMSAMFYGARTFNKDISSWDVSKVAYMDGMFWNSKFNGNISKWNVGNVRNMWYMFRGSSFTGEHGGIADWNVSRVTNMEYTFGDNRFNGDISRWNVSSVTSMLGMFSGSHFDGDISKWDVRNVTMMRLMFKGSSFTGKHGGMPDWQTGKVRDMQGMFEESKFNGDISRWDTSKVINMYYMFKNNKVFNQDLSKWDIRKVINIREMFMGAIAFNQDISDWVFETTHNLTSILEGATAFNQDIYKWGRHVSKNDWPSAFRGTALEKNGKVPDWAGGSYTGPASP